MRRTRYQHGSLKLADRKSGKVWEFRWREVQLDGTIRRKNVVIGTLDEYPSESAAQSAVDSIRLTINRQTPTQALKQASVEALVKHYREHELPEIYHERLPEPGERDDHQKSYSTQYAYEVYLKNWILPRWRSYRLTDVKAVDVEAWLKALPLARGTKAKMRNIMSALFSHAIRWEWAEKNPIRSVRQSAKRLRTPDVLTPEEITALLGKLPEPLRTAVELDAFTGLRRGELIGLQWQDVDFENLLVHVRRSVVMMVEGIPKTEASAKDLPLDAALAESLLKLKLGSPYQQPADWVFCFNRDEREAAVVAGYDVATLRKAGGDGGENLEARGLPHVSSHLHDAAHGKQRGRKGCAGTSAPREQSNYARSVRTSGNGGEARSTAEGCGVGAKEGEGSGLIGPIRTMTEIAHSLQVLKKNGGDDGTRTRGLCRDRAAF